LVGKASGICRALLAGGGGKFFDKENPRLPADRLAEAQRIFNKVAESQNQQMRMG
jgi:hypothetical protein